jgi:glycosyltransferase involved in cell wall biosynthesis
VPRVSVIVPTYNAPHFLVETVESILAQTYRDFELMVVDDGSEPSTRKALEPYMHRIRYVWRENGGPSAARNTGIRHASGELVAFCDHDDLWLPDKLERQMSYIESHSNAGLYYCEYSHFGDRTDKRPRRQHSGWVFPRLWQKRFLQTLTVVCRREVFDKAGEFDESLRYCQDYDMWLRVALHFRFGFTGGTLARYRLHTANLARERAMENTLEKLSVILKAYRLGREAGQISLYLRNRVFSEIYFRVGEDLERHGYLSQASRCYCRSLRYRPARLKIVKFWYQLLGRSTQRKYTGRLAEVLP